MKLGVALSVFAVALLGCGSSASDWTAKDTSDATHIELTSRDCEALCLSDTGCTPQDVAACLDGIVCSTGSMLHRHGASAHVASDAGCLP